jgi:tRNA(Ile)-lysidine synthase
MRLSADRAELTAETFAALMAPFCPFESRPVVAVAVSGGRDSLALALLAHDWGRSRGGRLVGLIVDHGLRAEAADEARMARDTLHRQGIDSEILRWTGPKPTSGLQQAAREARYRLLFEACRAHGILHLLVAHHADDQLETVAMRAGRGSGPDGLAGMAAMIEHRHVRLLRPLLGVRRAEITAFMCARGIAWSEDPSNADPRFERVRVRAEGRAVAAPELGGDRRTERERDVARAAVAALEWDGDGRLAIDRQEIEAFNSDLCARLLSRVVQAVGGRDHPPRRDRLSRAVPRLLQHDGRGKSGKGRDFTLSECRLMLRQSPPERRLRWIVRAENGTNHTKERRQPLIPAGFFACGAAGAPHLDCQPLLGSSCREPVQS